MKIDILKLAPAMLPFVPSAYRPLAQSAIDELIETRKREEEMSAHISELTAHVGRLTATVNAHSEQLNAIAH